METVQNGRHVVVKRARETRLLFVKGGTTGGVGKAKFDFNDLIGRRFGVPYEVRQKRLFSCEVADIPVAEEDVEDFANRTAVTANSTNGIEECALETEIMPEHADASHISRENVEKMRKSDAAGQDIVTKSTANTPSLRHKTAYAREKYLTKRAKKYSAVIVVYPPSVRLIHEIYYHKDADKISYLRQDCLAQLLTWANVHNGCRIAVVEQCLGIVTAAVLERMGGGGQCVRLHKGHTLQSIPCLAAMDYDDDILTPLLPVPLDEFLNLENSVVESDETKEETDGIEKKATEENADDPRLARREKREVQKTTGLQVLAGADLDSFIIAVKDHPLTLIRRLMVSTRSSRPFVVYCTYVQPLLDCYQWLREDGKTVNLRLFDSFYRQHQVLPGRSHPEMNQPVAAGYILTGVTVSQ